MATGKSDSDICLNSKFAASIDFKCACTCMSAFTTEACVKLTKNCYKSGDLGGKTNIKKNIFSSEAPTFFFFTLVPFSVHVLLCHDTLNV